MTDIDVTLAPRCDDCGRSHVVRDTIFTIRSILSRMGFSFIESQEVDDEYHIFDALNTPKLHPAREMQDTFYLSDMRLLRTHTSSSQIRTMKNLKPPIRIMSAGRVFRRDSDATHTPMFHQVEGLYLSYDANLANLKWCIGQLIGCFFAKSKYRFRNSFFPFTSPSFEVDIKHNGNWVEILGCGMVHPNVLRNCDVDHEKCSGFAFGLGVERFAMIKNSISDLRSIFSGDIRYLEMYGT